MSRYGKSWNPIEHLPWPGSVTVNMHLHRDKLWPFPGGLKLEPRKAQSTQQPLRRLAVAHQLIVPTRQHVGEAAEVLVKPGEHVLKGQVIARAHSYISVPVHATTSGTVVEVGERRVPHPSGLSNPCVVIEADTRDEWDPNRPEPIAHYAELDPASVRIRVRECGLVGLGGAAFPTAVKLNPRHQQPIHTLIINGVECEPYISCDDMLIRERAAEILEGARILRHALGNPKCLIAIEQDMPHAFAAMCEALGDEQMGEIRIITVPTIYPAGGERQLIKVLTGKEVPSDGLTPDIGIVCQNVGTTYAVYRAVIHGEPLISRILTVTGQGVSQPCNLEVRLGTPVAEVIHACGGYTDNAERLIMGGPMMGFAMGSDEVPVIKATNCLLVAGRGEIAEPIAALPCIRCAQCATVCPARLLPQELYWHTHNRAFDKVREYHVFDCIECGCCAYVCPSHIPLVQFYRFAKSQIWAQEREQQASDLARRRHQYRNERLAREKQQRAERLAKKEAAVKTQDAAGRETKRAVIAAALERVKAKKTHASGESQDATSSRGR